MQIAECQVQRTVRVTASPTGCALQAGVSTQGPHRPAKQARQRWNNGKLGAQAVRHAFSVRTTMARILGRRLRLAPGYGEHGRWPWGEVAAAQVRQATVIMGRVTASPDERRTSNAQRRTSNDPAARRRLCGSLSRVTASPTGCALESGVWMLFRLFQSNTVRRAGKYQPIHGA
jgi:hypothetical protein